MIRKEISRVELEKLYKTSSVRRAAAQLGLSVASFYKLLDKAGIERKAEHITYDVVE